MSDTWSTMRQGLQEDEQGSSPAPQKTPDATNGRTQDEAPLKITVRPQDAQPTDKPRNRWSAMREGLQTDTLLQENPGWTGMLRAGMDALGHGTMRGLAEDLGMPVDTLNAAGDFVRDYPGVAGPLASVPGAQIATGVGYAKNAAVGNERIDAGSTPQIRRKLKEHGFETATPAELGDSGAFSHWMDLTGEFGGANLPFVALGAPRALGQGAVKGSAHILKEMGLGGLGPASGAVVGEDAFGRLDPKWEHAGKDIGALAGNLRAKAFETVAKGSQKSYSWLHDVLGFGTGAKSTVGKALATTTQDLPQAITNIHNPPEFSPGVDAPITRPDGRVLPSALPTHVRSGDEGTIALAHDVASRDAKLAGDFTAMRQAGTEAALLDAKLYPENYSDVDAWLSQRQWALEQLANRRVVQAVEEADIASERAFRGVEVTTENANTVKNQQSRYLRSELLNAQDDMKAVVDHNWSQVNRELPVDMQPVYDRIGTLRQEHAGRPGQAREQFPREEFNRYFDEEGNPRFGPDTSLGTVLDLDSRVQQELRQLAAQDAPDRVYMAYLKRLSEALNEAKYSVPGADESAAIRAAVQSSRTYHDTFTRGPVGQVLGYDRAGGVDTSPGDTIRQFMTNGPGGVDAFNSLMRAVGARTGQVAPVHESAAMPDLLQKYLRQDFFDKVMANGKGFSDAYARQWMRNNAGAMQHFPQLRDEFNSAIRTQGESVRATEFNKQDIDDIQKQAASLFLGGKPGRLFNGAVDGPNQLEATRELVAATLNDPTGKAVKGLTQMAFDRMIADTLARDGASIIHRRTDGVKVLEWMEQHPGVIQALDEAVPGVADRFQRIANTFDYIERFHTTTKMPTPREASSGGYIRTLIARIGGANVFSKFFGSGEGASLQTAAIGSDAFKRIAAAITPDQATALVRKALVDPKLFEELTRNWSTPKQQAESIKRLSPYLYSVGIPIAQPYVNPQEDRQRITPNSSRYGPSDWPSLGVP